MTAANVGCGGGGGDGVCAKCVWVVGVGVGVGVAGRVERRSGRTRDMGAVYGGGKKCTLDVAEQSIAKLCSKRYYRDLDLPAVGGVALQNHQVGHDWLGAVGDMG